MDGWTPLAWSLTKQSPKTVQVLLDSGLVDVNKMDAQGCSALSFAAGYGFRDVVQILLRVEGVDIGKPNNSGMTPLDKAKRYPEIVKMIEDKLASA